MALCLDEKLVLIELVGANFLLVRLTGHGEEERKRHDLALKNLQRARDKWNKCKAQNAKIKEELMSIAWHPSRWWDWCMSEDEKKERKKLWK